jgi:hypothetical protein
LIGDKISGNGVIIMTNANQPDFIDELLYGIADVYQWEGFMLPTQKSLDFSQEEISRISQIYDYSEDTTLKVYSENGKVFAKYSDSPRTELLKVGENEYLRRESQNKIEFVETDKRRTILRFLNIDGSILDVEPLID